MAFLIFAIVAGVVVFGYWYGMNESTKAYLFSKRPPGDPPEIDLPLAQ